MRWGVISDIHSNIEAFHAVIAALSKEDVDAYLCLGDIIGYGADPAQCIAEVKMIAPLGVAGNHDWAACGLFSSDRFNDYARKAVEWTAAVLSDEDKEFLSGLELVRENKREGFTFVHGSLNRPEDFEYILQEYSALDTLGRSATQLCFVGHSHVPSVFIQKGERYGFSFKEEIEVEPCAKYIINAGSVGQPRDGDPQASYVIYDSENKIITIKRVPYDVAKAQEKIINAGLPRILAERLARGR